MSNPFSKFVEELAKIPKEKGSFEWEFDADFVTLCVRILMINHAAEMRLGKIVQFELISDTDPASQAKHLIEDMYIEMERSIKNERRGSIRSD